MDRPNFSVFFRLGGTIDTLAKLRRCLGRPFQREAKSVRGITVPPYPATFAGIRFDEIGKGDSDLDIPLPQIRELLSRPGKVMQVHVAGFDGRAILSEGRERILDHE